MESYDVCKNDNRTMRTLSYGARSICDWGISRRHTHHTSIKVGPEDYTCIVFHNPKPDIRKRFMTHLCNVVLLAGCHFRSQYFVLEERHKNLKKNLKKARSVVMWLISFEPLAEHVFLIDWPCLEVIDILEVGRDGSKLAALFWVVNRLCTHAMSSWFSNDVLMRYVTYYLFSVRGVRSTLLYAVRLIF